MAETNQLKRGLSLAIWGLALDLVSVSGARLVSASLLSDLKSGGPDFDYESLFNTLNTVSLVAITISWIAGLLLILGLRAVRSGTEVTRRSFVNLAVAAAIGSLCLLTLDGVAFAAEFNYEGTWGEIAEWVSLAGIGLSTLALLALLGAAHRVASIRVEVTLIAVGLLLTRAVIPSILLFNRDAFESLREDPWDWAMLMLPLGLASLGSLIYQLIRARARLGDSVSEGEVLAGPEDWTAASRGIRVIGVAIQARIIIAFLGILFLVLAALARSTGLLKLTLLLLPLATVIAAGAVVAGAARFRRVPQPLPARDLSLAALALLAVGFAGEVWGLVTMYGALGGEGRGFTEVEGMLDRDFYLQLVGLAAYVLLLIAMRLVAQFLRDDNLAHRAKVISIWTLAVFGGGAFLRRHLLTGNVESVGGALLLSGSLAIAAIVVAVAYSRIARDLGQAIDDRTGDGALPAARASFSGEGDDES